VNHVHVDFLLISSVVKSSRASPKRFLFFEKVKVEFALMIFDIVRIVQTQYFLSVVMFFSKCDLPEPIEP
jgi:hypothetical protein